MVLTAWVEAFVSMGRLRDFLAAPELQVSHFPLRTRPIDKTSIFQKDSVVILPRGDLQGGDEVININNADFTWNDSAAVPTLSGLNLKIDKGDFIAVVGRVSYRLPVLPKCTEISTGGLRQELSAQRCAGRNVQAKRVRFSSRICSIRISKRMDCRRHCPEVCT